MKNHIGGFAAMSGVVIAYVVAVGLFLGFVVPTMATLWEYVHETVSRIEEHVR